MYVIPAVSIQICERNTQSIHNVFYGDLKSYKFRLCETFIISLRISSVNISEIRTLIMAVLHNRNL